MSLRDTINAAVATAFTVTSSLQTPVKLSLMTRYTYNPSTDKTTAVGTPMTVNALMYEKKATRPTQRAEDSLYPERTFQTQTLILIQASDLKGFVFQNSDRILIGEKEWKVQEVSTPDPSIVILTVTVP